MEIEPANTQSPRHRISSIVFGLVVGLAVAIGSYHWITDPIKRAERERQESIVLQGREHVLTLLDLDGLEFVDPLSPQRKVGKVYIYPAGSGWEVSGFYRRNENDRWHAFLLALDGNGGAELLRVRDTSPGIAGRAADEARLEVITD